VTEPNSRWNVERAGGRVSDYDSRWERLAAGGAAVHGEADFVCRLEPRSVLDAGCGTGRVAIELAGRGIDVVGVDLDATMLDRARTKAPDLAWIEESIHDVELGRDFDVVVTAGNVMIFVAPGSESRVVANLAKHVVPGGHLVSGFQLDHAYGIERYDADCETAGLEFVTRLATWEGAPWAADAAYAVSVHRRTADAGAGRAVSGTLRRSATPSRALP